jgi:hypothetical protein
MAAPKRNQERLREIIKNLSSKVAESAEPGIGGDLVYLLIYAAGLAIGLVLVFFILLWILIALVSGPPKTQSVSSIVTAAISMTALVGASLGAVYAFRKQILTERESVRAHQQVYADRFVKASELLANDKPSARLAGLHLLASLADDWDEGRDSCARAMCSYLRLPPPSEEAGDGGKGEHEVRRTAWQVISKRLADSEARTAWHTQELDFSGGRFGTVDLSSTELSDIKMDFRNCQFEDGELRLNNCKIRDGRINFSGSTLRNMTVVLGASRLEGDSDISFDQTVIENCVFILPFMRIGFESGLWCRRANVTKTKFLFDAEDLVHFVFQESYSEIEGEVDFSETQLSDVEISMHAYRLSGRLVLNDVITNNEAYSGARFSR